MKFTEINVTGYSPTATVPEFIRPFQNEYIVNEGEKFKMDCLMIGNPRPKVRWYFNNQIININSKFCTVSLKSQCQRKNCRKKILQKMNNCSLSF